MNLQLLQEAVAAKVRLIPLLAGLPVREEQLGNIIETVQNDVLKTRFCVVVGSATFADEAPDSATCYGLTRIEVSIFEDPEFNRAKKTARRAWPPHRRSHNPSSSFARTPQAPAFSPPRSFRRPKTLAKASFR